MKTITKAALGALALASLGALAATPASAQSFGFSFGTPYYGGGYYGGYYGGRSCYGPYRFRPAYCFRPGPAYYGRPYYRPYAYYGFRDYRRGGWDRRGWRR
jgi:hypothetical protein